MEHYLSPVPPGSPRQFSVRTSPHDLQGASSLRIWVLPVPRPTCMSVSWQLYSFESHTENGSQGFMHCRQALYHTIPALNSSMRLSSSQPPSACIHSVSNRDISLDKPCLCSCGTPTAPLVRCTENQEGSKEMGEMMGGVSLPTEYPLQKVTRRLRRPRLILSHCTSGLHKASGLNKCCV